MQIQPNNSKNNAKLQLAFQTDFFAKLLKKSNTCKKETKNGNNNIIANMNPRAIETIIDTAENMSKIAYVNHTRSYHPHHGSCYDENTMERSLTRILLMNAGLLVSLPTLLLIMLIFTNPSIFIDSVFMPQSLGLNSIIEFLAIGYLFLILNAIFMLLAGVAIFVFYKGLKNSNNLDWLCVSATQISIIGFIFGAFA